MSNEMCAEQTISADVRQQTLRSELKVWERTFAEANGGQKAGKDDIKKVPDIAAKYKEYNRLRAKLNSGYGLSQETPRKSRKRKSIEAEYSPAQHPATIDPYDIPHTISTTPKITRTSIGPTPQKNGQVLGLFDLLSPYSTRTATPSKSRMLITSVDRLPEMQTPTRRHPDTQPRQGLAHESTPSSSAKRRRLDLTQTPSSQRRSALLQITPLSNRLNKPTQPLLDQTPAFLKRFSEPSAYTGTENELGKDIAYSPSRMRLPRKPVGRSLSQLVQSLRDQEDERLDEELALMREIETSEAPPPPKLLVQDSQLGDLPLGADGEHDLSEDDTPGDKAEPRRLWKKKGQKRTTRRANIGVNRAKWKPEAEWGGGQASGDETIPETQSATSNAKETAKNVEGKKLRKINPNAISHANFRSLKIKNKNSKGRKGGRFGRR